MKIFVNNSARIVSASSTLLDLMNLLYPEKSNGKAIALNNEVIRKGDWGSTKVKENDKILIITATQGG